MREEVKNNHIMMADVLTSFAITIGGSLIIEKTVKNTKTRKFLHTISVGSGISYFIYSVYKAVKKEKDTSTTSSIPSTPTSTPSQGLPGDSGPPQIPAPGQSNRMGYYPALAKAGTKPIAVNNTALFSTANWKQKAIAVLEKGNSITPTGNVEFYVGYWMAEVNTPKGKGYVSLKRIANLPEIKLPY